MTKEKVAEVLEKYDALIGKEGWEPKREARASLAHLRWMCQEAKQFCDSDERLGKAFRWLGFIQGALNVYGMVSIEQAKADNMPVGEAASHG